MASYLDQLRITLDEADEMEMSEGDELSGDVTETIEDDSNTDEVMEESAALEEDLEAMQENTEATAELVETEAATDAVLESSGEHSEEELETIAEATTDNFVVTLAKLGVKREDMRHFGVTTDNDLSPLERIRITNDGVKDFLSRLKEHIIAFFRTVKNKIKRLIAKLVVMVTNCTKKADAVIKKYKSKLRKHDKYNLRDNKTTMFKIIKHAPLLFTLYDQSIDKTIELTYHKKNTDLIYELSNGIVKFLDAAIENQKNGKSNFKEKLTTMFKDLNKNINAKCNIGVIRNGKQGDFIVSNNDYICTFKSLKEDHIASSPIILTAGLGTSMKLLRFVGNEDSDNWVPSIEIATVTVKQSKLDVSALVMGNFTGDDVSKTMEAIYQASKQVKGLTDGCYKHLEDAEKLIIKKCSEAEKEGEIKNGDLIKVSSIFRTAVSSAAFAKCMEYALGCRRLLNMSVTMAEALIDDEKQKKKDDKRTSNNN